MSGGSPEFRPLVVDGNWLLHRSWFTLRTSRPVEDVLPHNFVGLVMKDACLVRATHILVAFDGPNVFRYKLFPGYKASRSQVSVDHEDNEEAGKDVYKYLPAVRAFCERAGLAWIQKAKYESDDVIASAVRKWAADPRVKLAIMDTGDKDSYQSLVPKVMGFSSAGEAPLKITREYAEKRMGVAIDQMIMYQTLLGDGIDDIPQILSKAKARKACNTWHSFANWHKNGTDADRKWLRQNMIALRLNKSLVEMCTTIAIPELDALKVPKIVTDVADMPKAWHAYQTLMYPKQRALFRRK